MKNYNIRKIQERIFIILMLCLAAAGITSILKDQKLQETTAKAYEKCKKTPPTKTYQTDETNYVMFGNEQYKVTNEKYGLFIENKLCK